MNIQELDIVTSSESSRATDGKRQAVSTVTNGVTHFVNDNSSVANGQVHLECNVAENTGTPRTNTEAYSQPCSTHLKHLKDGVADINVNGEVKSNFSPQETDLVTTMNNHLAKKLMKNEASESTNWGFPSTVDTEDSPVNVDSSQEHEPSCLKLPNNKVSLDYPNAHHLDRKDIETNRSTETFNRRNVSSRYTSNKELSKATDLPYELQNEKSKSTSPRLNKEFEKHKTQSKENKSFAKTKTECFKQRTNLPNHISDISSTEDLSSAEDSDSPYIPTRGGNSFDKNRSVMQTRKTPLRTFQRNSSSETPSFHLEDPWERPFVQAKSSTTTMHIAPETSRPVVKSNISGLFNQDRRDTLTNRTTTQTSGRSSENQRSNSEVELERIGNNRVTNERTTVPGGLPKEYGISDRSRNDIDLLSRPTWCDAKFALSRVRQGDAQGNPYALKFRSCLQSIFFWLGCFTQRNAKYVLFLGFLFLSSCAAGLRHAHMETDINKLWVETGSKLNQELEYTKTALSSEDDPDSSGAASGYTIQMLIQTGNNALTPESLKLHLIAAIAATKVTVTMYNQTWGFSDVCYKETIPVKNEFDSHIATMLEKLFPCFIIGPLDCFWEGAKLLGPTPPIYLSKTLADITWTNVNPLKLINGYIETMDSSPSLRDTLGYYKNLMLQAGITTGYQQRWCLDPRDPECPETAPNYKSKELPDIKALLRDGCSGFASTLMQWPIDLIVGGIEKNEAQNITRAQGLQTLFNLMNANNMYEFHKGIKTGHDWSIQRAEEILSNWQRSFVEKIYTIAEDKNVTKNITDALHAFSETTAADILAEFSTVSYIRVMGGYLLMMGYACLSLMRWNASRSQGAVGVIGVLLIALSVAAGLGICSVFGISFNAASTQVLPFLLLGLGVDDMFLMAHHFGDISVLSYIPFEERTGECLKRVGVSVFLTSIAILSGFLFSLIIPMPALRAFGLQASIVTLFNLIAVLVVFPAILSVDLQRRKHNKLDILCCFDSATVNDVVDITQQNTIQNSTCDHVLYHQHHASMPPVHNPAALPGNNGPIYGEPEATTITMHHTIQAYSNDSYVTVLGPSTGATVSSASTPRNGTGTSTPVPPYETHPNTPPPEYTARVATRDYDHSRPTSRPRVAFVNQAISEPSTGRSTPATSGFNGRMSRRGNGSNPPTNLTTPMESVRSSTHSLVPHRRRGRQSGCFGKRSGSIYARLATIPALTISQLGERYYAPFLLKKSVRITVIILFIGLLGMSIFGATLIEDGLEFGDILPRGTREHAALIAQTTYFSFYNMYIVTKSFDYASNQKNLDKLHTSMKSISYVMRNTDGTLTKHWLDYMRDWLQDLQTEFDAAWTNGEVNSSTWTPQASDKTVLAFKLLLQTGRADQPIEKGNIGCRSYVEGEPCNRVDRVRLVSDDEFRTIPEAPFYNYLSAWVGNDPLAYSASQAQIRPQPTSWSFVRDLNMIIPRSPAIIYAQMPFYLNNMRENQDFVNVIEWVRGSIESVEIGTSVTAYPSGHPFTFWQQYIDLRFWLFISLGCVILAVFLVLSIVLFNPWAAGIMALFLTMIATELLGFMGAAKVKLSAVPAVILVASIGLGVEFTVHITFAYITSCGSREERVKRSIGHMLGPVIDGSISTLLGVVMLAGAEFDFIVTYFFHVLAILILLGFLNGVVLLPVLLSFIGPPPEVIPVGGGTRLKTPTPPPSPPPELEHRCPMHHHHHSCARANRNGDSSGFYCYPRRPPAWYQHHPHCTGSHFSSRDDMHTCHRPIHRRNAVRRRGQDETLWRQPANNYVSHNHHEGYTSHTPHCNRNFRYQNEMQRNEPYMTWQRHPFAAPSNPRQEDTSQVFVCPHAEYVVYSSGATPPNEPLQDNHCETESNNLNPSESSQGERLPGKGSNHRKNQVPTLTATSSLTVKVHSGRQPVVAFVEPPSTSTSRVCHNQSNVEDPCHQRSEPEAPSHPYQSSRRRFDISALTQQEPSDRSMHPNTPSS